MMEAFFALCEAIADMIASTLGIEGKGPGWALAFLLALVVVIGAIVAVINLLT